MKPPVTARRVHVTIPHGASSTLVKRAFFASIDFIVVLRSSHMK